ncbi:MAG: ATP-dependent DNA ligase [Deltaproteobacteria bacterium]|nr:ATP-dependent DNA ligase [Deltaproteobacteria bacterium]
MSKKFKPMLAEKAVVDKLVFPVIASPKLDGFRMYRPKGHEAVTRSFKSIPNKHIARILAHLPVGFDGELMRPDVVLPGATFAQLTEGFMRKEGEPPFAFHVFDWFQEDDLERGFEQRIADLKLVEQSLPSWIKIVPQIKIESIEALEAYEELCLAQGYEGVMVRQPNSPYKNGRSTVNQGYLLKIKRFEDDEGIVVGFEEKMHNGNEATKDEFGRTKRSSHQANKTGLDTLGSIIISYKGDTFRAAPGKGIDAAQRKALWDIRETLMGKLVTFTFQPSGADKLPRFPTFKCFREDI